MHWPVWRVILYTELKQTVLRAIPAGALAFTGVLSLEKTLLPHLYICGHLIWTPPHFQPVVAMSRVLITVVLALLANCSADGKCHRATCASGACHLGECRLLWSFYNQICKRDKGPLVFKKKMYCINLYMWRKALQRELVLSDWKCALVWGSDSLCVRYARDSKGIGSQFW